MESKSKLQDMTKDELKEYAADKYGIELSTSNRKDAMIDKFLYEREDHTGSNNQLERLNTNLTYAAIILGVLMVISVGYDIKISKQLESATIKAPSGQGNNKQPTGNKGAGQGGTKQFDVSYDDTDPVKGQADAPVTIIEFSDFQCPFCKRFFDNTLGKIEENYIKTGKVKLVYRDLPLNRLHPQAENAAVAAQCVYRIGGNEAFWNYHDKIFNNQGQLSESNLKSWAGQFVNQDEFNTCYTNRATMNEVTKDKNAAKSVGASGTPTFFINGKKLVGAQPYRKFKRVIESELN